MQRDDNTIKSHVAESPEAAQAVLEFVSATDFASRRFSAQTLEKLIHDVQAEFFVLDAESLGVVAASRGFCRNLGYAPTELERISASDIDPEHLFPICCRLREAGGGAHRDVRQTAGFFSRKNRSRYSVEFFAEYLGDFIPPVIFVSAIDVTLRSRLNQGRSALEAKLLHAQKMEMMGTFAGGVAHHLNAALMPILGYLDLALKELPASAPVVNDLRLATQAAEAVRDLVDQIRCFRGDVGHANESVDLTRLIDVALSDYPADNFPNVKFTVQSSPDCPPVRGSTSKLQEVVKQLCLNAVRALGTREGVIEIRLQSLQLSSQTMHGHPALEEGTYALLAVKDRGPGMNDEVQQRVFEPFFSTASREGRRGLGLSMVHGIVQGHGGEITFTSALGQGTTFYVYLPIERKGQEASETKVCDELEISAQGAEEILFVDDDLVTGTVVERMLSRLGYRVTVMHDSDEALKAFQQTPDRYALLISDYSMPKRTGVELACCIAEIRPKLPIIILSGYHEEILSEDSRCFGIRKFLTKPIVSEKLGATVREVLDKRADDAI